MENNYKVDIEILHKEIDLIQGIITRMSANSFLLKGWIVTIFAGVITLTKDTLLIDSSAFLALVLLLPLLLFWYLDAYFLYKERCYVKMYNWVIKNRRNHDKFLYDLNHQRFKEEAGNISGALFSETLIIFYGVLGLILAGLIIYQVLTS